MLKHVLRGLSEVADVIHRASGARVRIHVTLHSDRPYSEFSVAVTEEDGFAPSLDACGWKSFRWRGAEPFRFKVDYDPLDRYQGLPAFLIEAPFKAYEIRFFVETPHPHPALAGRAAGGPRP